MKIAQIAPLAESCPPRHYGGTERIVSYLTEELVQLGHDVTLFASGGSKTAAKLVRCTDMARRLNPEAKEYLSDQIVMLEEVHRRAADFDVLHLHIDLVHSPLIRDVADRMVITLHGRLDVPDLKPSFAAFPEVSLVSISNAQRKPLSSANWGGTVYHGLPRNLLRPAAKPDGNYLAFLGRISPEKRPDRAIKIAAAANLPLKIAAKIDNRDQAYWDQIVGPLVAAHPNVEFVGEIDEPQKAQFLGNAHALLFPIDWPEPFGLVMIEAMACGTPVIAFRCGSVPELVEEGIDGCIVRNVTEAVDAVRRIEKLDRAKVRAAFEKRFTVERMANDYLAIYRSLPGVRRGAARSEVGSIATEVVA